MDNITRVVDLRSLDVNSVSSFLNSFCPAERDRILKATICGDNNRNRACAILMNNYIRGIIKFGPLEWDTCFFKKSMARISDFAFSRNGRDLDMPIGLISYVIDKCREDDVAHIDARVEANDFFLQRALQHNGFIAVDIRASFWRNLAGFSINFKNSPDNYVFRLAQESDLPQLKEICGSSFKSSRFYSDPFFTNEEADSLHRAWIENLMNDKESIIFVAEYSSGIAGLAACHLKEGCGIIDLVAVRSEFRKQGIGFFLVSSFIEWVKDKVKSLEVSTQIYNYGAVNLYAKLGFNLKKAEISYSKQVRK
jgi:GNAT superfamily N-acetyltransferase